MYRFYPASVILISIYFYNALAFTVNAQDKKYQTAIVEKVSGVPVYLFSEPLSQFTIVGKAEQNMEILLMDVYEFTTVSKKAEEMVKAARLRQKKGKLDDFDAILVDNEASKSFAIAFPSDKIPKAKAQKINGISVFFFSKPDNSYDVIARLSSKSEEYEENGLLTDKVSSMIKRTLRQVKAGKTAPFDGMIFNPDDLSAVAIKFK
jgi:hypothetical protein